VLNNHVDITILYHEDAGRYDGMRVVGFEVKAKRYIFLISFSFSFSFSFSSHP